MADEETATKGTPSTSDIPAPIGDGTNAGPTMGKWHEPVPYPPPPDFAQYNTGKPGDRRAYAAAYEAWYASLSHDQRASAAGDGHGPPQGSGGGGLPGPVGDLANGVKTILDKTGVTGGVKDAAAAAGGAAGELGLGGLFGVDKAGPRPDAKDYYDAAEGTTAENLRRAYDLADKAGSYSTKTTVRDPGQIAADKIAVTRTDAPALAETERAAAADIGPAEMTRQTAVKTAKDTSGASALLKSAALGDAPSKAEALLHQGADTIARKQLSVAASARGSERRGAKRAAMLAIGEQGAALGQTLAAQRADEMAKSRGEFAQYSQQSQRLEQEANSLQAQIDAAAARGDAAAVNTLKAQQADLRTQVSQFNAGAGNRRESEVANLTQAWRESQATREQAASTADASNKLTADTTTAQLGQKADEANVVREQNDQTLRTSGTGTALGASGTAAGQQQSIGTAKLGADTAAYVADKTRQNTQEDTRNQFLYKTAGTLLLPALSDKRAKEDIDHVSPKAAESLASAYAKMVSTYTMKGSGRETAGAMAQDLEKEPLGKRFVSKDPDGVRHVDYEGLHSVVLAGLAAKMDAQAQRTAKARRTA